MLCIASFLVLLLLSAVSARFRPLAKRAWQCTSRRLTLRPCDTTFRDEVKTTLLAPLALRAPRWVKPASYGIEVIAWVMVISMGVSIYLLLRSGLNFAVYGTCNRENPEACVLAAEVCSIGTEEPTFLESVREGDVIGAFRNEFTGLADTIATVPSRLRTWDAAQFLPENATFRGGYREGLPTSLEVLDPGCGYCAQLFRNIAESGFDQTHNLSYIAYPIIRDGDYQFRNSELIARYLTALRIYEAGDPVRADYPTDWEILRHIFTENIDGSPVEESRATPSWQFWFNNLASREQATEQLHTWLSNADYSEPEIAELADLANSQQVTDALANSRNIVENEIRTLSIPTFIANGRLHRGSVSVENLQGMMG